MVFELLIWNAHFRDKIHEWYPGNTKLFKGLVVHLSLQKLKKFRSRTEEPSAVSDVDRFFLFMAGTGMKVVDMGLLRRDILTAINA